MPRQPLFPAFAALAESLLRVRERRAASGRPDSLAEIAALLVPTSSGQRRALAGLLATILDEGLDPLPVLRAWMADERGWQRWRVGRIVQALERGMPLVAALERAPGALRPQDATALAVAAAMHGDAGRARGLFDAPAAATEPVERSLRWALGYAATLALVALPMTLFLAVKILPQYRRIFEDFGARESIWLSADRRFMQWIGQVWWIPVAACVAMVVAGLVAPRLWGALRRRLGLAGLGVLGDARAADLLGSIAAARGAGEDAARGVAALEAGSWDRGLRARLRAAADRPGAGILAPAETAALAGFPADRDGWVSQALARRHRERVLGRTWLLGEVLLPIVVLLFGVFVFFQALATNVPLFELIRGLT